jgi:hypothetical protein
VSEAIGRVERVKRRRLTAAPERVLDDEAIARFVAEGFVHLPAAFDRATAAACVDELWRLCGVDRDDRASWTQPVVRVQGSAAAPLVTAINSPRLTGALDQLVGTGRWARRTGYGTFPIRFPSDVDPGDAGWHVDGSFEVSADPPPWSYGLNIWSRQRALLVLMLYTDVGVHDAPTRVSVGSHADMARALVPFGEPGASFVDAVAACADPEWRDVVQATGAAGDAYLCHPFLLHAASWPHRGTAPRFMGQPCIFHQGAERYRYDPPMSPCEQAVVDAIGAAPVS